MKRYISIVILVIFGISCRNKTVSVSDFEKENLALIDSIYSLPHLPLMNNFDITEYIDLKARKWEPLNPNMKVDSLFYKQFIQNDKTLGYWKDYQELYYLGKVEYKGRKYLAISQWIENGDECYIYLINFSNRGEIYRVLLVSERYKSPSDFDYTRSSIDNGIISRIRLRMSSDNNKGYIETCDSIIEKYNIEDYQKIYYDSIGQK